MFSPCEVKRIKGCEIGVDRASRSLSCNLKPEIVLMNIFTGECIVKINYILV